MTKAQRWQRRAALTGAALCLLALASAGRAEPPAKPVANAAQPAPSAAAHAARPQAGPDAPAEPADAVGGNAQDYCENIADAAADARFARQAEALAALGKEIDDRIAALEARQAEFKEWLAKREEFMRKADESVVAIFTQMRPDAAALQMAVMGDNAAAAILAKLNPRIASAILNEMDPAKAAQLTNTMAGLAKDDSEEKS
jgi:flagellar motility protein MotE (MotC chaperone)